MIKTTLRTFVDAVLDNRMLTLDDTNVLRRDLLADGLTCREEADTLIALDRAVPTDPAFQDYVVAAVVDYVVWTEGRTGYVDADAARWLATSLSCGVGPTETARRVAFETVKEAQQVDEALLGFVLSVSQRPIAGDRTGLAALAA
ncbi:MAG TPA: hypothetical protein VIL65_18530 [Beijerinckiaceae bacterium]|jgi:hypothetical protein